MLLFKPEHAPTILDGTKTQTRRLWGSHARVKAGRTYQARTRMLDKSSTFARLRILRVWREKLWNISSEDAWAEGKYTQAGYIDAFCRINHMSIEDSKAVTLWCVEFEVEHASE